jgi:hypothetical protein
MRQRNIRVMANDGGKLLYLLGNVAACGGVRVAERRQHGMRHQVKPDQSGPSFRCAWKCWLHHLHHLQTRRKIGTFPSSNTIVARDRRRPCVG